MHDNTVGSILLQGLFYNSEGTYCHYHGDNAVYHALKAVMFNPLLSYHGVVADKFRIAECDLGLALRSG